MVAKYLIGFLTVLLACTANAGVYKWVDDQGRIHYGDQPPENADTRTISGQISSYESVEVLENNLGATDTQSASGNANNKRVVIYSASWCPPCKRAKAWFSANNIPFTDYDVETSKKGARDYKKLKGKGVPIILVGKKRLNGFSEKAFKAAYYK